jgi:hypothetical protein
MYGSFKEHEGMVSTERATRFPIITLFTILAVACGGEDDGGGTDGAAPASTQPGSNATPPPQSGANTPPTIAGRPFTAALVDSPYSFTPTVSDANGDILKFSVTNRPPWASLNPSKGQLRGTPTAADIGTYANIRIDVTDGHTSVSLPAFSIVVTPVANGTATLTWMPPTENEDGTPLTNLAGYKIYWGPASRDYLNTVAIQNPGITTYVVENLVPGTYFFAISSLNSLGAESAYSNEAVNTL